MTRTEAWTIGRLLEWTTEYLKQRGSENPRLDAEVLLAEARGCERIALYTDFHTAPDERERTAFRELVRRRAEGEPVAYLVGRREFYSLLFEVTPAVLIPRPETEFVVVELLDRIRSRPDKLLLEVADVGTGSGVIAVCAARHASNCRVLATDLSPDALEVARRNVERHQVADRVELLRSDLLSEAPRERRFDFIVSNPPYVSDSEYERLAPEVRRREPKLALAAGPLGIEVISRLIEEAEQRLQPGGWLITEISPMIQARVEQLFENRPGFNPAIVARDLAGLARVVASQKASA